MKQITKNTDTGNAKALFQGFAEIEILCNNCRKWIAIESSFPGSMCRCPYCKSIVVIAGNRARLPFRRPLPAPVPAQRRSVYTRAKSPPQSPLALTACMCMAIGAFMAFLAMCV